MKKRLFIILILISTAVSIQAQVYNWAYKIAGTGWTDVKSTYLANDNSYLVTGMFTFTTDFGGTSVTSEAYQDAFVAKYSQNGTLQWVKTMGGNEQDWGYDVCTDNNDNVYVIGYFQSSALHFTPTDSLVKSALSSRNVFTAKYSNTGVFQWARLGSAGNTAGYLNGNSITCDAQNNVIISGSYNKQIEFDGTQLPNTNATNIYLVKYTSSGTVVWAKAGVSGSICWLNDLVTDANNNIYCTGKISTAITFGNTTIQNHMGDDMVIGKFDASGNLIWMTVEGKPISASTTSNNFDCGNSIKLDGMGNVFVGGSLLDTTYYDMNLNMLIVKQFACVAKYNNNGVVQWQKSFGNHEKDVINAIDIDANNDVYCIGNYSSNFSVGAITLPVGISTQCFVAKFSNSNGNELFAYKHGNGNSEVEGYGLSINQATGNVYTAGHIKGNTTFGANTLTQGGTTDVYLVLLNNSVVQGIHDINSQKNVVVYPNPASDYLQIKIDDNHKSLQNARYSIYNLNGQKLAENTLLTDRILDVEKLPVGEYILEIKMDSETVRTPFLKK